MSRAEQFGATPITSTCASWLTTVWLPAQEPAGNLDGHLDRLARAAYRSLTTNACWLPEASM